MIQWQVLCGDVRERLAELPAGSVQCCVTSPPYWGLRDYGHTGQIGLEPTPDAYVAQMVGVFAAVRQVLADDGVLWLNLGASYLGGVPGTGGPSEKQLSNRGSRFDVGGSGPSLSRRGRRALSCDSDGIEPPNLTASDSACSDLCDECLAGFLSHRDRSAGKNQQTKQSSLLSSQTGRDSEPLDYEPASLAVSLPVVPASNTLRSWQQHRGECLRCANRASALSLERSFFADAQAFSDMTWLNYTRRLKHKDMVPIPWMVAMALQADGWYLRSDIIWSKPNPMPESVTDRPTKAHEYIFLLSKSARYYYDAEAIAEASSGITGGGFSPKTIGAQLNHGAVRLDRPYDDGTRNKRSVWHVATQPYPDAHFATYPEALIEPCILAGSKPGDTILDPFCGSGTTGAVAVRHQRNFVGIELNPAYVEMSRKRIGAVAPLFASERTA